MLYIYSFIYIIYVYKYICYIYVYTYPMYPMFISYVFMYLQQSRQTDIGVNGTLYSDSFKVRANSIVFHLNN